MNTQSSIDRRIEHWRGRVAGIGALIQEIRGLRRDIAAYEADAPKSKRPGAPVSDDPRRGKVDTPPDRQKLLERILRNDLTI